MLCTLFLPDILGQGTQPLRNDLHQDQGRSPAARFLQIFYEQFGGLLQAIGEMREVMISSVSEPCVSRQSSEVLDRPIVRLQLPCRGVGAAEPLCNAAQLFGPTFMDTRHLMGKNKQCLSCSR